MRPKDRLKFAVDRPLCPFDKKPRPKDNLKSAVDRRPWSVDNQLPTIFKIPLTIPRLVLFCLFNSEEKIAYAAQ